MTGCPAGGTREERIATASPAAKRGRRQSGPAVKRNRHGGRAASDRVNVMSRPRSTAAGLLAMAVLAGIVVGLPIVLYRFGGSPLPGHVPGWHRVLTGLESRDDGTLLLTIVRDCSWLAWLLFTVSVAAEAQAAVRGRGAPRLRLGGLQGAAAHLVAVAAVTFAAPAVVTLAVGAPAMAAVSHGRPPDGTDPSAAQASARVITVRAGDCLWAIAQHYLGAGDRYPEIASLNYGRDMGDGLTFNLRRGCTSSVRTCDLTRPPPVHPPWQHLTYQLAAARLRRPPGSTRVR
jgi:hypothetical protein